jgi:hypothetical protein
MSESARPFHEVCAACGAPLTDGEWHPVVSERSDGEHRFFSFCDEDCQTAWADGD